jgi:hypothetical protein
MKNIILIFLLGTTMMFSQSTTVRNVTLSYDKVKKLMTLNILPKTMVTNDTNMDVRIEIYKEVAIKMVINGKTSPISKPYFEHTGHTTDMSSYFYTRGTTQRKQIKKNYIYEFSDVKVGEEYVLIVSNVCDEKYVTNQQTVSIIIK